MPADIGDVLGIEELEAVDSWEEAYERREEVKRLIEAELQTESTEYWLNELWKADIWCGPVNDLPKALEHPHIEINDMVETVEHPSIGELRLPGVPVRMNKTPGEITRPLPRLGEHTDEIFDRVGFSPDTDE